MKSHKVLMGVLTCFLLCGNSSAYAEDIKSFCVAHNGEFMCLEDENEGELIKKVESLKFPDGEYIVLFQKSIAWTMKKHFSNDKRVKSAKIIYENNELSPEILNKLKSEDSYYVVRLKVEN